MAEPTPSAEMIISALVGVGTIGLIAKKVWDGWKEASKSFLAAPANGPVIGAVLSAWDRTQTMEFLKLFERLVVAHELQTEYQEELVDRRNETMQKQIAMLVERTDALVTARPPARRRPARKPKA